MNFLELKGTFSIDLVVKDAAKYSREELIEMMDGLEPSGDEMIRAL